MNIGISAFAWTGSFRSSHIPLIAKAREFGFSAFEVPMYRPTDLPARALRAAFEESGLIPTICAILPSGINPISSDAAQRRRSFSHLKECVETAAEIGAHLLGGPVLAPIGYLPGHRPTADEWAWAAEACQRLVEVLESHDMTLCLEPVNRSETFLLRTAAEANRLCAEVGCARIGVTIDTFHANIEERSLVAAIHELGGKLKHMHMSDNDRGLLGEGHLDFASVVAGLRQIDYTGLLIIEAFGFDPKETEAPGYLWADPLVSPDVIATKGLKYLESLITKDAVSFSTPDNFAPPPPT